MRKVLILTAAIIMLMAGVVSAASVWGQYKGNDIIRITVDGSPVKVTDAPAFVFDNRTFVPIYLLKEAGIQYSWDSKNKTVDVKKQQKTSASSNTFNPTQRTNEIISLGGGGITIVNLSGDMTALVYFDSIKGFDGDWDSIFNIFLKLVDFDATYSRIIYMQGQNESTIEIETRYLKDYINGKLDGDQLLNYWFTSGYLFSVTNGGSTSLNIATSYPELYSNDGKTYLGKLTTNIYDSESIFNEYGTYGSKYQSKSIWNDYGTYGSEYSSESAFNKYATKPPIIVLDGKTIGHLTLNTTFSDAISPIGLKSWLEKQGY